MDRHRLYIRHVCAFRVKIIHKKHCTDALEDILMDVLAIWAKKGELAEKINIYVRGVEVIQKHMRVWQSCRLARRHILLERFVKKVREHRKELLVLADNPYDKRLFKRFDNFDWDLCKEFIIRFCRHCSIRYAESFCRYRGDNLKPG